MSDGEGVYSEFLHGRKPPVGDASPETGGLLKEPSEAGGQLGDGAVCAGKGQVPLPRVARSSGVHRDELGVREPGAGGAEEPPPADENAAGKAS